MKHSNKSNPKPEPNSKPENVATLIFEAIGTRWSIQIFDEISEHKLTALREAIIHIINRFDKNYSRFRPDSLVTKMSKEPGNYALPGDAKPLLDFYRQLYEVTDGQVTPLIGTPLSDAGYDANYSLQPKHVRPTLSWDEAMDYDYPTLTIKKPSILDFGGAGKGYLVDLLANFLVKQRLENFCINASGDINYKTQSDVAMRVALENPNNDSEAIGVAQIRNQAICGSGGDRRKWANYHHILDPKTLKSPQHIKAVWAVAETTMLADGLTTALFFCPPALLAQHFAFEFALVRADNSLEVSKSFPAEFFKAETDEQHEKNT
jgi:thiamine biosynthesis lipoprotein